MAPERLAVHIPVGRLLGDTPLAQVLRAAAPPADELHTAGEGLVHGYIGAERETFQRFGHFSPEIPERLYRTNDMVRIDAVGDLRFLARETRPGDRAPGLWAMVDRIPLTDDGKVDRAALFDRAAPAAERPPNGRRIVTRSARDNMRSWATALFAETTGSPHPRDDEDFFTAGGDSLRAVRLISLLGREFDVTLRLRDFMLSPTPAGLSRLLEEAVEEATQQARK
jgi:acyl carrier protein